MACVKVNDRWGFINTNGQIVIKPQFEEIDNSFYDKMAAVMIEGKMGFINQHGKMVIKPQFEEVIAFSNGIAWVKMNGLWGCIDKTGKQVVESQYDYILFSEDYISAESKGNKSVFDKTGRKIAQGSLVDCDKGIAIIFADSDFIVINQKGDVLYKSKFLLKFDSDMDIPSSFYYGREFNIVKVFSPQVVAVGRHGDKIFAMQKEGNWGFIDDKSDILIQPQFSEVKPFYEGLAPVKVNDKWGFINISGGIVITPQYESPPAFSEGMAAVTNTMLAK